jgi:broad specificity polyphosphatase/5'/3'-nucleotidase SurE
MVQQGVVAVFTVFIVRVFHRRVLSGQASLTSFFKPTAVATAANVTTSAGGSAHGPAATETGSPTKRARASVHSEAFEVIVSGVKGSAASVEVNVSQSTISAASEAPTPDNLNSILSLIDESWRPVLQKETKKPYFSKLEQFIANEYNSKRVFPPRELIFTAFNLCPLDKVKGAEHVYFCAFNMT